jgi:hypothetical protein
MRNIKHKHLFTFGLSALVALVLSTFLYIYFYPLLFYNSLERAIVQRGLGVTANSSGIPINTLYTMPTLASPSPKANLLGANHDTLYTIGVLDLSKGPQILHVPDMAGRYYSIEFVDSWGNDFAYVGRRTTGTQAGDYLISGPEWNGNLPEGLMQIVSPDNKVLLIGRVLVENDNNLTTAYGLSKQIQLTPLSH